MNKKGGVCIYFLFFLNSLIAQINWKQPHIYLQTGAAIATDNLGKKLLSDHQSGFGATGYYAAAGVSFPSKKNIHFFAELNAQHIPISREAMSHELNQANFYSGIFAVNVQLPVGVPAVGIRKYPNWQVARSAWRSASFMMGITKQCYFTQHQQLGWILKGGGGLLFAQSPALYAESFTDTATAILQQNQHTALGINLRLGIGLSYQMNKQWGIQLNNDYDFSPSVIFKNITVSNFTSQGVIGSSNYSVSKTWFTGNIKQQINSFHASMTLTYQL